MRDSDYLLELARSQAEMRVPAAPPSTLDWSQAISLARHHGLLLVLGHHLLSEIPSSLRAPVKSYCLLTGLFQERLRSELQRIQLRLTQAGCPVLPLKGVALADRLYGAQAHLRPTSDLDLLVPLSRVRDADQLLTEMGYRCCQPLSERWIEFRGQIPYLSSQGIGVELHWRPRPLGSHLNEAAPGWLADGLADEDLLLYLADHGAIHWWQRLQWLADFARLISSRSWCPQQLHTSARRYRLTQRLSLACTLAETLLDVPSPIRTNSRSRWLGRWLSREILSTDWPRAKKRHLVELLSLEGPGHLLRQVGIRVLTLVPTRLLEKPTLALELQQAVLRRLLSWT